MVVACAPPRPLLLSLLLLLLFRWGLVAVVCVWGFHVACASCPAIIDLDRDVGLNVAGDMKGAVDRNGDVNGVREITASSCHQRRGTYYEVEAGLSTLVLEVEAGLSMLVLEAGGSDQDLARL